MKIPKIKYKPSLKVAILVIALIACMFVNGDIYRGMSHDRVRCSNYANRKYPQKEAQKDYDTGRLKYARLNGNPNEDSKACESLPYKN